MLKPFWQTRLRFNWAFGLVLILLFGGLRVAAVLYGIQTGDNKYLSIIFILMAATPFIFMSREGRHFIGFRKINSVLWLFLSFLIGVSISSLVYLLGEALYGDSLSNWFRYIGTTYPIALTELSATDKRIFFTVFAIIGMTFSPFGEEILYRGMAHSGFAKQLGDTKAAVIDSAAFGLTHLAHFGIVYASGQWRFLLGPAMIWVLLMFLTGIVFNYCKGISDSIWGSIISHMGFNLAMTYYIFYPIY